MSLKKKSVCVFFGTGSVRPVKGRFRRSGPHLELRPVHGHVDAVGVGPPPEVLLVVGVVDRVVELLVDLRQAGKSKKKCQIGLGETSFRSGQQWDFYGIRRITFLGTF